MKLWNMVITLTLSIILFSCSDEDLLEKFATGNYIPVEDSISYTMKPRLGAIMLSESSRDTTSTYGDTTTIYAVADDSVRIYQKGANATTVTVVANELVFSKGLLGLEADSLLQKQLAAETRLFVEDYKPTLETQLTGEILDADIEVELGEMTIASESSMKDNTTGYFHVYYQVIVPVNVSVPTTQQTKGFSADLTVDVTRTFETLVGSVPPKSWPDIQ